MNPPYKPSQIAIRGAMTTGLWLFGGLLLGFVAASLFHGLPMHLPESRRTQISMLIVLVALVGSGFAWGRAMARLTGATEPGRMAWAGALSFGPALILAALALGRLEVALIERGEGPDLPVHLVFTLLFVPAAIFVAGTGGFSLGLAREGFRLALRLALTSGLAGGMAFLLINLVMFQLGYKVGAPGAAERATMLTVMMAGSLGAALAGGAAIGVALGAPGAIDTMDKRYAINEVSGENQAD
jgi:hypothetical protein